MFSKPWMRELVRMFFFWAIKKLGELSEYLLAVALEIPKPKKKRKGVKSRKRRQQDSGAALPNRRVSPLTMI